MAVEDDIDQPAAASADYLGGTPSGGAVDPIRWSMRLVHGVHRISQRPVHRQEFFLEALCARFDASAGALHTLQPRSDGALEPAHSISVVVRPPAAASSSRHRLDTYVLADLAKRSLRLPALWLASAGDRGASGVACSLIALQTHRRSLLELHREPTAKPISLEDVGAIALVHQECAWACEGTPSAAASNVPGLSPRERQTLEHLLAGASEKEVASTLRRSRHTVHSYVKRIYRQLGVRSRAELLAIFVDAAGRGLREAAEPSSATEPSPADESPA